MTAPDAQPPPAEPPHDPTHVMHDADTGICCDCACMVDPLAAPVAAALDSALSAFNSAVEFGTPDEVEHGITIALRAAFRAVPPAAALAGTTTPTDDEVRAEAARRLRAMAKHHSGTLALDLLGIADWLAYAHNVDDARVRDRALASARALLASTPTEETNRDGE